VLTTSEITVKQALVNSTVFSIVLFRAWNVASH
jgi:hypothetical protein